MPRQSSYTGRYKMTPERIMQLRREMGWTQAELCDAVSENRPDDGNGTTKLQSSVVSAWETGRRPVPDEYAETIAKIFGVTKGYLYGFTDDPKTEASEPQAVSNRDQKIEIPLESLFKFHDMPVYVVFPTKQHMDGWGIYDDEYKQIVFRTYVLRITIVNAVKMKFYRSAPSFVDQTPNWNRKALSMKEMLGAQRVYVCMQTHDPSVRAAYNGWYKHNEDNTFLIKAGTGLVLPYDGLSISYNAYPNKID